MVLIIGGKASGKREYARSLGYTDDDMTYELHSPKPVLCNLENIVRQGGDVTIADICDKDVITCCEVGSGIVPIDEKEMLYREKVGRLCVEAAKRADKVVRMICGIPIVIKGDNT